MSRLAERSRSKHSVRVTEPTSESRPFAILCRALRRDRDLLLKDQAAAFGCSIAYISAIETGRKGSVPEAYIGKLVEWLGLDDLMAERLRRAADQTVTAITLRSTNAAQAQLFATLGRSLEQLTRHDIDALRSQVLEIRQRAKTRDKNERTE